MEVSQIIDTLVKFRYVDKYESFHKLQPGILHTNEMEKQTVSDLLDSACKDLTSLLECNAKLPRTALKKTLVKLMDDLSHADISSENREFAYQLGWYLAEKTDIDLRKVSARKIWGFWQVEADEVKVVKSASRKIKPPVTSSEIKVC